MYIYKDGKNIGVQNNEGQNFFYLKEDNANPPKGLKYEDTLKEDKPKQRKKKAVINEPDDI